MIKAIETSNIWHDSNVYCMTVCGILRRTRATNIPVQPTTEAIRASVSNVRNVNKSSKLFNCERNEPVWTDIKLYGAIPKKKIFNRNQIVYFFFFLKLTKKHRKEKDFFWNI